MLIEATLPGARELAAPESTTADVRQWARTNRLDLPDRGRLCLDIWTAYQLARKDRIERRYGRPLRRRVSSPHDPTAGRRTSLEYE